jgi:hypothetical protein
VRSSNNEATGQAEPPPRDDSDSRNYLFWGPKRARKQRQPCACIAERVHMQATCVCVCVDARLLFLMKEGGRIISMMGMKKGNGDMERNELK